jgi:hypothetical protein
MGTRVGKALVSRRPRIVRAGAAIRIGPFTPFADDIRHLNPACLETARQAADLRSGMRRDVWTDRRDDP